MKWCLYLLPLLIAIQASAQRMEGTIFDRDSKAPLEDVSIINKRTGTIANADKNGRFILYAYSGDTLLFYRTSYLPVTAIMPYINSSTYRTVYMEHLNYRLKEAVVTSDAQYKQDSISMRETFQHSIDYNQPVKPKVHFGFGIAFSGLFSALAEHLLGQTKKKKRFLNTFANDEYNRFVDSRYTPELVRALTGLSEDSAAHFMNATPMPYDYARNATDLELKMWIRYNYRQWLNKIKGNSGDTKTIE